MNAPEGLKAERDAAKALRKFLGDIPHVELKGIEEADRPDAGIDLLVDAAYANRPFRLAVEVKTNGEPRNMGAAALQAKRFIERAHSNAIPLVMAPFLSEQARAVCVDEGVGYLDFFGNARIASDRFYIERSVPGRPEPERRAVRSLFKPKAARILRVLFRSPGESWRVIDLAKAADVSVGLVSNIGTALRERGWSEQTPDGLRLIDPDALLDAWTEEYVRPKGEEHRLYTHLHGAALTDALVRLPQGHARIVLASFSAADWQAPYVRQATTYLYADESGLETLARELKTTSPSKGANLIVRVPDETGVLDDSVPVGNGLAATSPVQTYLDLMRAGERGREGAAHLRAALLEWNI